ncbi:MAG: glycosyltransferase family 39 protein [Candidatus Dormibacteria bacterium]
MSAQRSIGMREQRRVAGALRARLQWLLASYAGRIIVITLCGLAARLALIAYQPLWRDEAFTAVVVNRPMTQMLDTVRADSAPPLAYVVERFVAGLWSGPAGLRLVPAIAGACAIPIGAALARRIADERGGVVGAAVCAAAPSLVLSAVDARMYAIATTLVMAATLALWRAAERPTVQRWVVYAVLTTAALYTDYFAAIAIPAQLLATLILLRAGWRRTILAATSALSACMLLVPWLLSATQQLAHTNQGFWVQPVGIATVGGTIVQFFAGPGIDSWVPFKPVFQGLQGITMAIEVLAIAGLVMCRRTLGSEGRSAAWFCTTCGVGAVALLVPVSIWHPVVDGRYASVMWGPLFAVVGAGLALVPLRRPLRQMVFGGIALTAVTSLTLALASTHPPSKQAIASLQERVTARDVIDAHPSQYLLFLYYAPPSLLARTRVVQEDVPWFWGTAAYPPGAIVSSLPPEVAQRRGTVYYVRQPDEGAAVGLPSGYVARDTQCWTGVCITAYTR